MLLVLDDLGDFIKNPARDRTLLEYPGNVCNVWDLNWCEVLRIEGSSFVVSPSEGSIMCADDPLCQPDFLGKQELPVDRHLVSMVGMKSGRQIGSRIRFAKGLG